MQQPEEASTSPQSSDVSPPLYQQYSPDATLLLIGFSGAGKKTLGIIASVALRRRFIDFEAYFEQQIHCLPADYIAAHGSVRYREVELTITRELLSTYEKGSVISGLGCMASHQQQALLREFSRQHPVVYVRREKSDLRHLIITNQDRFDRIFEVGNAFFHSCANFDFFNCTQELNNTNDNPPPTYLKLKETETDFVRFLHHIFGRAQSLLYSVEPFSASRTYALQVPLAWLESINNNHDYEVLESGVDAVSLIIMKDTTNKNDLAGRVARQFAILRRHTRVPIIVDIESSAWENPMEYHQVVGQVLRLAPDAFTCSLVHDENLIRKLDATKGHAKMIATYHQSLSSENWTSPETYTLPDKAHGLGFDALRVTHEPNSLEDNMEFVSFLHSTKSTIPVIGYNTGALGRTSVCLNPTLSPTVLPSMKNHTSVTLQEAQQALVSCFLCPKKQYTIFGQTVSYSLSPEMHNAAYRACGLPHEYNILQSDCFSDIHLLLNDPNQGGFAISLPYKTEILLLLNEISPDARDIHAVNTVVVQRFQENGKPYTKLKGYNTDYIGIRDCIDRNLSPANAIRRSTTALIIGAGGMAHAAVYACHQLGVQQICVYNRTPANAQKLAHYYHDWTESKNDTKLHLHVLKSSLDPWPENLRPPTIIVSCIPARDSVTKSPVTMQLPQHWLTSKTGGVFLDVRFPSSFSYHVLKTSPD